MNIKVLTASILVFAVCTAGGFWVASHKPIWNDEFYTTQSSIYGISYTDQIAGKIPEGSNAPLFYVLQKAFCQLSGYPIPAGWQEGNWCADAKAQIMLRVVPVVCVSLSMSIIFYYFSITSLLWGAFSLFIYLSSYMLWIYWAEARPYPVIVLVVTLQSLFLLRLVRKQGDENRNWIGLIVANILCAFTFIFSVGLTAACALILWFSNSRHLKKYILAFAVPVAIALFYYAHAPKYNFYFDLTPEQLIRDNFSRDRFYILIIFGVLLLAYGIQTWTKFKKIIGNELIKVSGYFAFVLMALLATLAVMGLFGLHQCKPNEGFAITSRYFIYLMPIGVIATTLFVQSIVRSLSAYRWAQVVMIATVLALIIPRYLKIVPKAIHSLLGGG